MLFVKLAQYILAERPPIFLVPAAAAFVGVLTPPNKEAKLGMASKATGTTASKPEVISEVSDAVKRMQKLAGIIK